MLKNILFSITILLISQLAFAQESCPVIPLPQHAEKAQGVFMLHEQSILLVKDSSFSHAATFFKNRLLYYTGVPLVAKLGNNSRIILQIGTVADGNPGGYILRMQPHKITVTAENKAGAFNGMMTLLQLAMHAKKTGSSLLIPCWNIEDEPLYAWRGIMLDESRHFFGKKTVKMLLDWMTLYKLNRFHWHLTDAPGWRMEIKKYPRLTNVGGIGNHSDSSAPAKYYTQDDIREIVAYAKARHIEVIPEIDMPGHATAANRAYPQFSGGGTGKYANFTFNPGKNGTYQYLTDILKEVAVLFPSSIVHLGGDEVSFGSKSWNKDTDVQELMKDQNLENLKEVEHYFLRRMTDSALQFFNKVAAWDEATDAHLPKKNTIIYWWRHDKPEQLKKALTDGYQVILCPRIPLYFDFVQDSTHIDGRRWAGKFSTVKQVYDFSTHTYPEAEQVPQLILGMQGNLWTETVKSEKRLEFLFFPRMAALAEAAWTKPENRDYRQFLLLLKNQFKWYQKEGVYYFNPISPKKTPEVVDL